MSFKKETYIGKGKVKIGPYDQSAAMIFVGNVSQLDITYNEDEQTVPDYTEAGGGEYDSIRRITAVNFQMTMWDLSPANLAMGWRGTYGAYSVAPVVGEVHKAFKGGTISLDRIPDPAIAITVAPATGSGSFDLGTDYIRTISGIEIVETGDIEDEDDIKIGYTPLAGTAIEVLTQAAGRYKILFEGLNEADSGKPIVLRGHNARLGAMGTVPMIGDAFASTQLNGDLLKDLAITTPGKSQYYQVLKAA